MKAWLFIVNLALLGTVVYLGAGLVLGTVADAPPPGRVAGSPLPEKKPVPGHGIRSGAKTARIVRRNLFHGLCRETPGEKGGQETSMAPADLDLRLRGTVASDRPGRGFAVIEDPGTGKQSLFRAGDKLAGDRGALIVRVQRNQVVVRVKGRDRILAVAAEASKPAPPAQTPNKPPKLRLQNTLPAKLAGLKARFRPVPGGGMLVYGIQPASALFQAGLRNGDRILEVDEKAVTSPADLIPLKEGSASGTGVRLRILRKEETYEMVVDPDA